MEGFLIDDDSEKYKTRINPELLCTDYIIIIIHMI